MSFFECSFYIGLKTPEISIVAIKDLAEVLKPVIKFFAEGLQSWQEIRNKVQEQMLLN